MTLDLYPLVMVDYIRIELMKAMIIEDGESVSPEEMEGAIKAIDTICEAAIYRFTQNESDMMRIAFETGVDPHEGARRFITRVLIPKLEELGSM